MRPHRFIFCLLGLALLGSEAAAQLSPGAPPVDTNNTLIPTIMQTDQNNPMGLMSFKKERTKVVAPQFSRGEPVTMESDEMGYDKDGHVAIARGHVIIVQDKTILDADEVIYYQDTDLVEAKGHVVMLEPSGDVYFADYARLSQSMKHGILEAFKARLNDNSVFVANEAQRVNPAITKMHRAVFTPCRICEGIAPFWDIKSDRATINEYDQRIYYHDARLDMFGVPLAYSPYFSTPTPDAEAKSGFLNPSYSRSSQLGLLVRTPYYWRIDHSQEMTVTPWWMTGSGDGSWLLQDDYNAVTDGGVFKVRASATDPRRLDEFGNELPGDQFRGHIYADGEQDLTENSRVGFDIARTTDDTYLRRYGFGDQTYLFSRAFYEAAQDRNYVLAQTVAFQGLEVEDDPGKTPLVLPDLSGYYETDPLTDYNLRFHVFGDAASLTSRSGPDERRLSVTSGANLTYVTDGGQIFTPTLNLRQDFYAVNDVPIGGTTTFSGDVERFFPQASLEWRYPLIRQFGSDSMTIEPLALAIAQPYDHNTVDIPDEDNTLIELNQTNLFSLNRMPGLDTIDSGPRLAYGARSEYLFANGSSINALLGQDYNFDSDTPFPNSSTPGKSASDVIGAFGYDYQPINVTYDFAFNSTTFAADQTEIIASYSKPWLGLSMAYRALEHNQYLTDSKEGIINVSLPFSENWTIYTGARRNLELNQMVAATGGLLYRNECFNIILNALREYSSDRDVAPNTSVTLRIGFKDLGEFGER